MKRTTSRKSHVLPVSLEPLPSCLGAKSQTHFYIVLETISVTRKFLAPQFLPIALVEVRHSRNISPDLNAALIIMKAACYVQHVKMPFPGLSGSCPVKKPNSLLTNQKYSHKTRFSCGPG